MALSQWRVARDGCGLVVRYFGGSVGCRIKPKANDLGLLCGLLMR